ncbi:8200_t:CDS:2, partial [Ambispora gerdemannii]
MNLNPIEWGFDGLLNGVKSPTLSNLPQIQKIIELSTKCVDVAQCCTGGDVCITGKVDEDYIPKPSELNPIENNFIKVVSGENHFFALTRNGEGLTVTEIACGGWHSALSPDLYTFGWNNHGRLG